MLVDDIPKKQILVELVLSQSIQSVHETTLYGLDVQLSTTSDLDSHTR